VSHQPEHLSFWRQGLAQRATGIGGPDPVQEYLVRQANLRGFWATSSAGPWGTLDPALTLEEIVVGMCMSHALADGRVFSLVLAIAESGKVDPGRLRLLAEREKAHVILDWLFRNIPASRVNEPVKTLQASFAARPPRGSSRVEYRYDFNRLLSKPKGLAGRWNIPRT
jgi:hypothetical protein